ncbi:MAG: hypothetical protein DRR19_28240 [Candidatus Parabeggiatoa sp. nov. 1]|nr:MAG: hypothetical protein DRR19_28240 [Gammaproteobacteria bacterium]
MTGKIKFNIKINELPTDIEILENKWVAFVIDAQPDQVKVVIRVNTWNMWQKAAEWWVLSCWSRGASF